MKIQFYSPQEHFRQKDWDTLHQKGQSSLPSAYGNVEWGILGGGGRGCDHPAYVVGMSVFLLRRSWPYQRRFSERTWRYPAYAGSRWEPPELCCHLVWLWLKDSMSGQCKPKWHHQISFHTSFTISLLITNLGYYQVPTGIKKLQENYEAEEAVFLEIQMPPDIFIPLFLLTLV